MTVASSVRVGTAAAQATIDAAAAETDMDALLLRVGVLRFLQRHASDVLRAEPGEELAAAYRAWLDVAVTLYSGSAAASVPDYARAAARLNAELELTANAEQGAGT